MPLLGDPLLLLVILLLVAAEQIHVVIVVLGSGGRSATHVRGGVLLRLGELLHAGGEGLDVVVPPEGVGRVLGGPGQSLKHGGVSLTGNIPVDVAVFSKIVIESLDSSGSFEVSEHLDNPVADGLL